MVNKVSKLYVRKSEMSEQIDALYVGLERFPITLTLLVSLPGLTGQSSTHGRCLLDRPVKPGDDSELCVPT